MNATKHQIARDVSQIPFSIIREMSLRAAEYSHVISLGIGEPDFHTPAFICQAALADALAGATHYTASQGDPELLQAVNAYVNKRLDINLATENIMISTGGMGALTAYFKAVLEPGDEVLVPEPYFPAYRALIEWPGGRLVGVPTRFEDGFVPNAADLAAAVTSRTKVLLLNSPHNPTGAVIPGQTLDELAQFAIAHDLLVISDEVYEQLVFTDPDHESIYTRDNMAERTVVLHSFSKSYAMTGWRVAYAFGPPWLIAPITKVASYFTSCPSSVSQRAALAALRGDAQVVQDMAARFKARCQIGYDGVRRLPGVRVMPCQGAFYLFPDIRQLTTDSRRFALDLLDQQQVVVVPGEAFGASTQGYVRLACTVSTEKLKSALAKMAQFIADNY